MNRRLMLWRHTLGFVFLAISVWSRPGIADPSTRLYVDSRIGFHLRYPKDAIVSVGHGIGLSAAIYDDDPIIPKNQKPALDIELKRAAYEGTNFAGGGFYVGVSNDHSIVSTCTTRRLGEQPAPPVKLDGVHFSGFASGDGGVGTLWNWTSYRAVHGDSCYEIVEWLSWTEFDNYPVGTVRKFDRKGIERQLRAITESFKFRVRRPAMRD